ncbi:MAG: 3-deoxy-manno-octulosonate cytidylyltransferase [candidate division KSB1 bacterium]|nr:3-deoxy-manno-octulosonate cytidylyltransferase [candidate division KSB1 bacterium]MDZ7319032.1 3-deoxy-manno-octulosonate cytidylyltransferase [candidate division KSB1 bacterium]MDZ7341449.1 3-deoxy-manno-octulosonate cytidylyltransferase [candidate division KSB1 bacterium]
MTATGIIPARYASSRFPGKPLANILGKPMIQWVYERAIRAQRLDQVIVATDDRRIYDAVKQFGGQVTMTSPEAANGTERVAEVARTLDCPLVVNLQGDEPTIEPAMIDQLVELMLANTDAVVGTLMRKIEQPADLMNPNIPKVVVDEDFNALYFSRAAIPFFRDEPPGETWLTKADYYQHIGMYIYRRDFLMQLVAMPQSRLEQIEKLEQLRVLENGYKIKVAVTKGRSFGVDIPEDIQKVETYLSGRMG